MCSPSKLCQLRIYDNDYILSKNKFAKKMIQWVEFTTRALIVTTIKGESYICQIY